MLENNPKKIRKKNKMYELSSKNLYSPEHKPPHKIPRLKKALQYVCKIFFVLFSATLVTAVAVVFIIPIPIPAGTDANKNRVMLFEKTKKIGVEENTIKPITKEVLEPRQGIINLPDN